MLTIRATKKLLDRCGGPSSNEPSTTRLGDWYATVLFWRPQVVLFVNEQTRCPVFAPFAPITQVVPRFIDAFGKIATQLGVALTALDAECALMNDHAWAKTASRSVVGSMNDFAFLADHARQQEGVDLVALSLRLARTPCGPLRAGAGHPDRALLSALGAR